MIPQSHISEIDIYKHHLNYDHSFFLLYYHVVYKSQNYLLTFDSFTDLL